MGDLDSDTRKLAKVVEHPVRARIIELLGERGPMGWKDLSTELGVKTGALYHHLDTLEGLVERDSTKKYYLSKSGRIVFSKTSDSHTIEAVQSAAAELRREGASGRLMVSFLAPRSLVGSITSSRTKSVLALTAAFGTATLFAWATGTFAALYYVHPDPGSVPGVTGLFASLTVILASCYGIARFAFKADVDLISLAAATTISFAPVLAFSAITLLQPVAAWLASSSIVFTGALVFFQAWIAGILGDGLSVVKGVRIEKTLLVGLVVLYATMAVMLVQGVPR